MCSGLFQHSRTRVHHLTGIVKAACVLLLGLISHLYLPRLFSPTALKVTHYVLVSPPTACSPETVLVKLCVPFPVILVLFSLRLLYSPPSSSAYPTERVVI